MRIGFLYLLHEYHVYHSAPTAFELSRLDPSLDVHLYSSHQASTDLILQLSNIYPGNRCTIHPLKPPWSFTYFNVKCHRFPKPRTVLKNYAASFRDLDAIIGTTYSSLRLKEEYDFTAPKYIMAFHGSGDRAYGFKPRLRNFDLLLLSGPKICRRLKALGIITENNWAMVGYPKFDVIARRETEQTLPFPEKRPVVLYNPHFKSSLSSWFLWGREILDFFAQSSRYNLIFAPHVELKGRTERGLSLPDYKTCPNIHIDLGSPASLDMSYSNAADLYLGDVSSQIYEFLLYPRPCIFLNSHGIAWQDDPNYLHWQLGPVVDDLADLETTLTTAADVHERYHSHQVDYFNDSIQLTDVPSALRAAQAILSFLRNNNIGS